MADHFGTLVDSNVLLDIFTQDKIWAAWSATALAKATEAGPRFLNGIVDAEISIRFGRIEDLDEALPAPDCRRSCDLRRFGSRHLTEYRPPDPQPARSSLRQPRCCLLRERARQQSRSASRAELPGGHFTEIGT